MFKTKQLWVTGCWSRITSLSGYSPPLKQPSGLVPPVVAGQPLGRGREGKTSWFTGSLWQLFRNAKHKSCFCFMKFIPTFRLNIDNHNKLQKLHNTYWQICHGFLFSFRLITSERGIERPSACALIKL